MIVPPYCYAAVYRGRGPRGGILLDVDLGFYRWRRQVPVTVSRRVASRLVAGHLEPGDRVVATFTTTAAGSHTVELAAPGTPAYTYAAEILHVTDGDTVLADIDLGLNESWVDRPIRLAGCNAIELKDPGGREARDNLVAELAARAPDRRVLLRTAKPDKYGDRIDARVILPGELELTGLLISSGWAAPWDGKGPRPVPEWPRPAPF